MTSLLSAKHQITEIDGIRCTLIESGVSGDRMEFLSRLLAANKLEVKVREESPAEGQDTPLYTIGVTDIVFNPVYAIYERRFFREDGSVVTPAYWRQTEGDTTGDYWTFGRVTEPDLYE